MHGLPHRHNPLANVEETTFDAVFENPVSEEHVDIKDAKEKLAKRLSHRADLDDLVNRNILRGKSRCAVVCRHCFNTSFLPK